MRELLRRVWPVREVDPDAYERAASEQAAVRRRQEIAEQHVRSLELQRDGGRGD